MDHENLIELVRLNTILYDITDKRYSDSQKKDAAWRQIAKQLNTTDKECKKTWNCLRDAFRRAIKRQKDIKSGSEFVAVKKWKFEDELSFLLPYLKERTTNYPATRNEDDLDNTNADTENDTSDNARVFTRFPPQPAKPVPTILPKPIVPEISHPKIRRPRHMSKKYAAQETPSAVLMKYILNKAELDEIGTFFSSMAATVKKFPPRQRAIAKAKVFSVISKLEFKILSRPSTEPEQQNQTVTSPIFFGQPASNYSSDSYTSDEFKDMADDNMVLSQEEN